MKNDRLIRVICPQCKKWTKMTARVYRAWLARLRKNALFCSEECEKKYRKRTAGG